MLEVEKDQKKTVKSKRNFSHHLLLTTYYLLLSSSSLFAHASQYTDTANSKVYKVAVFAPLYLDSVFTDNQLRSERSLPKFIMPAVEFVQGTQIAFDTLPVNNQRVEAFIYDTKSFSEPLTRLIQNKKLDSLDLIIGSVRDADFKMLSDFSSSNNIPFISATYPNDGGVTDNPFLVIMNSTLKVHCEGIYNYVLQNYGTEKIYLFKKPGVQEDKIATYFKTLNEQEGKPLLNIQTINFDSTFSAFAFKKKLDSNHNTIIIGASLDEEFAQNLAEVCYSIKKNYPLILIGMPNWDGIDFFDKEDEAYKDFAIRFTSPYFNARTNSLSDILSTEYNNRYKSKPTDVATKGFETAYYFTRLLVNHPNDFMLNLNDSTLKVFNDFNFKPILISKDSTAPAYFENKHLYVMRMMNGVVTREW
jgi:hypothetical protein